VSVARVVQVLAVPGTAAGYYEDRAALAGGFVPLSRRLASRPATPGFRAIREPAEALSVGLVLDTGYVAWGDCVADPGGGKPIFRAGEGAATIRRTVAPFLEGREIGDSPSDFRNLAASVDGLVETVEIEQPVSPPAGAGVSRRALFVAPMRALRAAHDDGPAVERIAVERSLHPAVRFGVGQALLRASARVSGLVPAQVVAGAWDLPLPTGMVPIHARAGHDWYYDAERMIVRRVDSLPHGPVDDADRELGPGGAELSRYLRWLAGRIRELAGTDYRPAIHLDLRGALGRMHADHVGHMLGQLYTWQTAAAPYSLRIQDPVLASDRQAQIGALAELHEAVRLRKMSVQLAAGAGVRSLEDVRAYAGAGAVDWIHLRLPVLGSVRDTVDAVLACRAAGMGVLLDGGVTGTDLSARAAAHLALACRPDLLVAGPGLGADEGISLVRNEMARALAMIDN
jgi:methylaspartate ammonia-lyase